MNIPSDFASAAAGLDFIELDDDRDAVVTHNELTVTRSKLGDLLDLLPAGLLIHQEQGVVYANLEAARILGVSPDGLVGRHFLDFVDDADAAAQRVCFVGCLIERELVRIKDCVLIGADGRRTNVQVSMSPLPWEGLPVIYVLLNDVTALKETEDTLRRLSLTDSLTGVSNRRHFIETAEREVERVQRYHRPLSMLMLDIDHFKRVNDTYGHHVGDEALKVFTAICQRTLRRNDLLGRMGGEEFAILLPETDAAGARRLAERIRHLVMHASVPAEGDVVRFTVSIGIASCRGGEHTVDTLLSCADEALYQAKHAGRNRVVGAVQAPFI